MPELEEQPGVDGPDGYPEEFPDETPAEPEPYVEPLPQFILLAPDYDPSNPDHVLRWERAGRPNLEELDSEGNRWKPTVRAELQEDGSYAPILLDPPAPLTDVEILAANIQARLDQRQLERTGIRPDPAGAVPRSRALAAAAMSLGGWGYPSVADLTGDSEVVAILAALYADPTSNTTAESSNTAKRRAVQYVRIMAEGAAFGEEYSDALTAYERTASPGIQASITADQRDWMALPCGPWETVRAMFLALLK